MHSALRNVPSKLQRRLPALSTPQTPLSSTPITFGRNVCTSCRGQGQRSITQSATSRRALAFSLNPLSRAHNEEDTRFVRMIMFGKPGAGKGTLTARLRKKYDIVTISTGDLLRQHIAERTEIGQEAEAIMARGGLLPDETVLKVVTTELDSLQSKNWILDGFPRTVQQSQLLDAHLKKRGTPLTLVVNLDVPDKVILGRIADRWVHLPSGRVYNMSYNRPRVDGLDDVTGEPLTKRPDDNPDIFARRLREFYSSTAPLLAHFAKSAASDSNHDASNPNVHPHQVSFHRPSGLKVRTLSGSTSDEIWPQLDRLLQNTFPGVRERLEPTVGRREGLVSELAAELETPAVSFK